MSIYQYCRADTLIKRGEVVLEQETSSAFYFNISNYSIILEKRKEQWSCTCEAWSMWSKGKKECSHIMACKKWLEIKNKVI